MQPSFSSCPYFWPQSIQLVLLRCSAKLLFVKRALAAERLAAVCVSLPACANVAQCASLAKFRPDARALVCVRWYSTPRQYEVTDVTHEMADLDQTHGPVAPAVLPSDTPTHTQCIAFPSHTLFRLRDNLHIILLTWILMNVFLKSLTSCKLASTSKCEGLDQIQYFIYLILRYLGSFRSLLQPTTEAAHPTRPGDVRHPQWAVLLLHV